MPRVFALLVVVVLGVIYPAGAVAQTSPTGGAQFSDPVPIVAPGAKATLLPDGTAAAPAEAPPQVQAAIFAANKLLDKPYKYGGGHAKVEDSGYDCSGTISYALIGASLQKSPLNSTGYMGWGVKGKGSWITVYSNPGHAYVMIAGLRLDTSAYGVSAKMARRIPRSMERGPRWRPGKRPTSGFTARHPLGL